MKRFSLQFDSKALKPCISFATFHNICVYIIFSDEEKAILEQKLVFSFSLSFHIHPVETSSRNVVCSAS